MITPRFQLSQDDNNLYVTIHAPFSRVSDAEVYMDGSDFRFHSNPYYLRLNLPGDIVENDDAKAHFDAEKSEFKVICPKVIKGAHFKGLDMLSSLLQPKGERHLDGCQTGIEVVSEDAGTSDGEETEYDWFLEQKLEPEPSEESLLCSSTKLSYGFGLKHSGLFSKLAEELHQVVDVANPDTQPLVERRAERLEQEKKEFNPEHYLADFFQTDNIDSLLVFEIPQDEDGSASEWNEAEHNLLRSFKHKEFLMDHDTVQSTYLGLVDILLAFCYDSRTTMCDPTVESAWTIAKISGTLSWLEVFTSIRQVAHCFLRRSLTFPLYRNFKLSVKVMEDAVRILKSGRRSVLKRFLLIHQLFNKSEPRYLLNQLYIQDYCIWIQKCSEETLASLGDSMTSLNLTKEDLDLNLVDLERAAITLMCHSSSDEDEDDSDLEGRLARMSLDKKKPSPASNALPMDLLVAAEAARESSSSDSSSSSSESESELDSDDLSSEENGD